MAESTCAALSDNRLQKWMGENSNLIYPNLYYFIFMHCLCRVFTLCLPLLNHVKLTCCCITIAFKQQS